MSSQGRPGRDQWATKHLHFITWPLNSNQTISHRSPWSFTTLTAICPWSVNSLHALSKPFWRSLNEREIISNFFYHCWSQRASKFSAGPTGRLQCGWSVNFQWSPHSHGILNGPTQLSSRLLTDLRTHPQNRKQKMNVRSFPDHSGVFGAFPQMRILLWCFGDHWENCREISVFQQSPSNLRRVKKGLVIHHFVLLRNNGYFILIRKHLLYL